MFDHIVTMTHAGADSRKTEAQVLIFADFFSLSKYRHLGWSLPEGKQGFLMKSLA